MKIYHNHLGYEKRGFKSAIVESGADVVQIDYFIKDLSNVIKYEGKIQKIGKVKGWKRNDYFLADFSDFICSGDFYLEIIHDGNIIKSNGFKIAENIFGQNLAFNFLDFFKTQRSSGRFDKADQKIKFHGSRRDYKDLRGGWFDASGDVSKYLSHLSYANFMNPQQVPLVVWNLLQCLENIPEDESYMNKSLKMRITDEASFGADFLIRMQDGHGYFYQTLFDGWSKDINKRVICSYSTRHGILSDEHEASFRSGGGMAIAALARMSAVKDQYGDFNSEEYLNAAVRGFEHLEKHNIEYLPDGKENIIDDYCALLAATELMIVDEDQSWYDTAEKRALSLCTRFKNTPAEIKWFFADEGERPFFHASDAGLAVISLIRFLKIAKEEIKNDIISVIKESLLSELAVTSEVNNPFGYARQIVKPLNGEIKSSFFIPHENESGYWWQGENARIASLTTAALTAIKIGIFDEKQCNDLKKYAVDQIDWILGRNPFDICMMQGRGYNNPEYVDFMPNVFGGVCNGITSAPNDENDIAFLPGNTASDFDESWRWSEQWIPHAAWFMLALSSL